MMHLHSYAVKKKKNYITVLLNFASYATLLDEIMLLLARIQCRSDAYAKNDAKVLEYFEDKNVHSYTLNRARTLKLGR